MALLSGLCAGKVIAGVVAIGATSFLGYNWVTTGCPTGVCPTERAAQAAMVSTSLTTTAAAEVPAEGCCALTAETATSACAVEAEACYAEAAKTGCCSADKAEQVAITTVAATLPAAPEGQCCSDKGLPEPCSEQKACCIENYNLADKTTTP